MLELKKEEEKNALLVRERESFVIWLACFFPDSYDYFSNLYRFPRSQLWEALFSR